MGHDISVDTTDEPTVEEGDTVVLTGQGDRIEADIVKTYDDGSFMMEWTQNGEERGQISTPKVFDRTPYVNHEPAEDN